ncbi:hypothetical protein Lal_00038231 [Lupinus albus]|nr:hypothetical protein Lal_00038231 [Lupinus albus]
MLIRKFLSVGQVEKRKKRAGQHFIKPNYVAPTPTPKSTKLHQNDGDPYHDPAFYRRLIGRVLYLANSRFAIHQLSQFMSSPTTTHYKVLTRALDLSEPLLHALTLEGLSLATAFFLVALISRKSKKQNIASLSSSEAEYCVLVATSCEIQWLTYLLQALSVTFNTPALLYCICLDREF